MRKVLYVSGSRADFSPMAGVLSRMQKDPRFHVGVCVTGTHLLAECGNTVSEVVSSGLEIVSRIDTSLGKGPLGGNARAVGEALTGLADAFSRWGPDAVLLFGDRGEMVAGAIAALQLNIPIIHLHGGERSGTVDEPSRHAISKMAHFHLVALEEARVRLIRMGEQPDTIHVVGAPGLDSVVGHTPEDRASLYARFGLDLKRKTALVVFHPIGQDAEEAGGQMEDLLHALDDAQAQGLVLFPNADAGADRVRAVVQSRASHGSFRCVAHMPRPDFLSWLYQADAMVGNSSSGIIEAASANQWVINVGRRQSLREQSGNVVNVAGGRVAIADALRDVFSRPRTSFVNRYGDGQSGSRIVETVAALSLSKSVLNKINAY